MFSSFSVFFLMLYIIIVVVFNSELELHNSPVSLCVCASSYITSTPTHTFMVFDPPQFHRSLRVVGGHAHACRPQNVFGCTWRAPQVFGLLLLLWRNWAELRVWGGDAQLPWRHSWSLFFVVFTSCCIILNPFFLLKRNYKTSGDV